MAALHESDPVYSADADGIQWQCPPHAEAMGKGWKDPEHLHNLRHSNPCKDLLGGAPRTISRPRGYKDEQHLAALDASAPGRKRRKKANRAVSPRSSVPRSPMSPRRAQRLQLQKAAQKIQKTVKKSAETLIAHSLGQIALPTIQHRDYYPYNSSRMLQVAQTKRWRDGMAGIPRGEKLPKGWKDAEHEEALRQSNPAKVPHGKMFKQRRGQKSAAHIYALHASAPIREPGDGFNWQCPPPAEPLGRAWKDPEHLHNLRRSNPCKVPQGHMQSYPRGYKDSAHIAALEASTPRSAERAAKSPKSKKKQKKKSKKEVAVAPAPVKVAPAPAKENAAPKSPKSKKKQKKAATKVVWSTGWKPWEGTRGLAKGWKDPEHLHNLRHSNPCKVPHAKMVSHPRGWKDAGHIAALNASDPSPAHDDGIQWLCPPPAEPLMKGWKDPEHLHNLRRSNPLRHSQAVIEIMPLGKMKSYPRGHKGPAHIAALEASDPTSLRALACRCAGSLLPAVGARGYYPYNSSRMLHVAQTKRWQQDMAGIPRGEKLPKGWKDAEHEEALRQSNPAKVEHTRAVHKRRGHKNKAHKAAQKASDPQKKKKTTKPPSIQSIIASIMQKEEAPKSPRSPRNAKAVEKALGISSAQEAAIQAQSSPRLRAKAVGAAILQMRPLTSCANVMARKSRGYSIMQPRFN